MAFKYNQHVAISLDDIDTSKDGNDCWLYINLNNYNYINAKRNEIIWARPL